MQARALLSPKEEDLNYHAVIHDAIDRQSVLLGCVPGNRGIGIFLRFLFTVAGPIYTVWSSFENTVGGLQSFFDGCVADAHALPLGDCVACNGNSTMISLPTPWSTGYAPLVFLAGMSVAVVLLELIFLSFLSDKQWMLGCLAFGIVIRRSLVSARVVLRMFLLALLILFLTAAVNTTRVAATPSARVIRPCTCPSCAWQDSLIEFTYLPTNETRPDAGFTTWREAVLYVAGHLFPFLPLILSIGALWTDAFREFAGLDILQRRHLRHTVSRIEWLAISYEDMRRRTRAVMHARRVQPSWLQWCLCNAHTRVGSITLTNLAESLDVLRDVMEEANEADEVNPFTLDH